MNSDSFKQLGRLVNGISLIAKEIAKWYETLVTVKKGDFETLVTSSLKKSVVSVTDLLGLTRVKVREFSSPKPEESVVYFGNSAVAAVPRPVHEQSVGSNEIIHSNNVVENAAVEEKAVDSPHIPTHEIGDLERGGWLVQRESQDLENKSSAGGGQVVATAAKRWKLMERKVPSTAFTRALGFAGLAWGTIQESAKRLVYGAPQSQDKQSALSPFLSDKNTECLALALCRTCGAEQHSKLGKC